MEYVKLVLLTIVVLSGLVMGIYWYRSRLSRNDVRWPTPRELAVGFGTEFFDALGIGSFAPTTALFKLFRLVPDELIPGTLIVGHCCGVILQSLIFVTSVAVDPLLLAAMVLAATVGSWFGAGIVSVLPRRTIQLFMGVALIIAGAVFAAKNLHWLPSDGIVLALSGWKFWVAVLASLILGALMTAGIGMYAPTMILIALLGMNPLAAFPIMMGACALLQSVSGIRFIRSARFAFGAALGLTLGGFTGVLIAAFVVKELPLEWLRWLVVGVVFYAAIAMLRARADQPALT
jgi:uncharacterized membrane protein YfcA